MQMYYLANNPFSVEQDDPLLTKSCDPSSFLPLEVLEMWVQQCWPAYPYFIEATGEKLSF